MYLIDLFKKKSILEKIELSLGLFTILALILSFNRIYFANELLILCIGIFSLFYMICGVFIYKFDIEDVSGTKFMKSVFSFYSGINFAICLFGILFKVMLWPNAEQMIVTAFWSIVIFFTLVVLIWVFTKSIYSRRLMLTYLIFAIIVSIFYFTSTDTLIDIRYRDSPNCAALFKENYKNPNNETYKAARRCIEANN